MTGRILVVDDDKETTNIFRLALTKLGYDATITGDVPSALAAIDKHIPDVILLDIMLPGRLGLDVLAHVRSTPELEHVFVVIISAHQMGEYNLPTGVLPDAVLRKPIRLPDLRRVLAKALA
ncbi:MAG: response regulator [Chloroflexota bacterium]